MIRERLMYHSSTPTVGALHYLGSRKRGGAGDFRSSKSPSHLTRRAPHSKMNKRYSSVKFFFLTKRGPYGKPASQDYGVSRVAPVRINKERPCSWQAKVSSGAK